MVTMYVEPDLSAQTFTLANGMTLRLRTLLVRSGTVALVVAVHVLALTWFADRTPEPLPVVTPRTIYATVITEPAPAPAAVSEPPAPVAAVQPIEQPAPEIVPPVVRFTPLRIPSQYPGLALLNTAPRRPHSLLHLRFPPLLLQRLQSQQQPRRQHLHRHPKPSPGASSTFVRHNPNTRTPLAQRVTKVRWCCGSWSMNTANPAALMCCAHPASPASTTLAAQQRWAPCSDRTWTAVTQWRCT